MVRSIIWTKRANRKFNEIIEFLEVEWNPTVVKNFVVRTYSIIELLAEWPYLGTLENSEHRIRGFRLTKHNKLFYRVTKKEIVVLNFFDNRQQSFKRI